MRKNFWLILISLFPILLFAQEDSIFARNSKDTIAMFFPFEIKVNNVSQTLKDNTLFLKENDDEVVFINCTKDSVLFCKWANIDKKCIVWNQPSMRYTNIKGGVDSFMVWSDSTQKILKNKIYINASYAFGEKTWTWYAIGFYFVIIASAIVFFWIIYYNMQRQKMQRVRNQISDDLHDEVGASLGGIGIFAKLLKKKLKSDQAEMLSVVDNIIEVSSYSVQNLRDSVWAINPQNDTMEKLFGRMCSFASELLYAKEIQIDFKPSVEEAEALLQKMKVKMEQRRAIYLIFKEIIHNILKHSEATATRIEVKKVRFGLEMVISDNGKGFDLSKVYEGNGMKTLQSRAKASLIDLTIDTALGKGTSVKLFIPEI